jgi:hypothetical protein
MAWRDNVGDENVGPTFMVGLVFFQPFLLGQAKLALK